MHKLIRGAAPRCLAKFQHGRDNWGNVDSSSKSEIWIELETMQGARCAYCESDISIGKKHIEHFRQKGRDPKVTFDWSNLFGSCMRKNSCGKHKDEIPLYDSANLIKPDNEDPEIFLVFSADGSVHPRANISEQDFLRAKETIRIFNLDDPLQQIRKSAVCGYVQTAEVLYKLASELPEENVMELLLEEINKTANLPFCTAIKHVLLNQA
ncbi:TIGR02646 family protein [Methylotenera oryzisoli]|uniref:TIGR02646 family protein n=1 Tax=Methylotenera oryzisoli TaxID=2080758 RepID=A0A4Y9VUD8_9PROT|nr:retron Ec78 anti-phage system effector HNH endonuclease PtuB [Methylotenera oryzisoli]TFW72287.1 TIGR02646 family protein [Methylotenera oryzisoli]